MKIEQVYTGCLAQGAYYIESEGEVAIIDPMRDVTNYIRKAKAQNATIKYVLETHFHADFVSGHLELARMTGAEIVFGPTAAPSFPAIVAEDKQIFKLGKITLEILHTPGHTKESCCYLLRDEQGNPQAIFTGDTLFLNDVGRPDLAQKAANMTREELAGLLFDSLRNKIMPLPDDIIVYPAHGAGSACGKNMSNDKWDTLGNQKHTNYALRADMTKQEFIKEVTDGLLPPPVYFPHNVAMNQTGYASLNEIIVQSNVGMSADAFNAALAETNAMILDTRNASEFAKGFIPGSINIGINGSFAPWVGTLVKDIAQPILLIVEEGQEEEAITRLARIGYHNCLGYLAGGVDAWLKTGAKLDTIETITADEAADRLELHPMTVLLDVRRKGEFESENIMGSENIPLNDINEKMDLLDRDTQYVVCCAAGYRSMIFISILRSRGFNNFTDIQGGFQALKRSGRLNVSDFHAIQNML